MRFYPRAKKDLALKSEYSEAVMKKVALFCPLILPFEYTTYILYIYIDECI